MCTFITRLLMNGDEVVRERTLYLFVPSEFPTVGCVSKLYRIDIVTIWMSSSRYLL
jgi:hypothetical protein